MNYQEFAQGIKAKYPAYKDADDRVLARKMVEKYPVYKDRVTFEDTEIKSVPQTPDIVKAAEEATRPEAIKDTVKTSVNSAIAPLIGAGIRGKTAQGVGQGAIQGLTLGYGMPLLRNATGTTTGEIKEPTAKEEAVGNILTLPIAGAGVQKAIQGIKGISAIAPLALGYAYNPSNTKVEPALSGKRAAGAAIGGLIPASAGALRYTANKLPSRIVNSLIKPDIKQFLIGRNPGEAIVNEGIIGKSIEDMNLKTSQRLNELTATLNSVIKDDKYKSVKIDLSDIYLPINKSIEESNLMPNVNSAALTRLNGIKEDIANVIKQVSGVREGGFFSTKVSPETALKIKRILGKNTKFTGNASEDALVNAALKQTYHAIDDKIDTIIPESKQLNERISNLIGASTALRHQEFAINKSNLLNLGGMLSGIATGAITANPVSAAVGVLGYKAASSTPAKTAGAQALRALRPVSRISDLILKKSAPGVVGGQVSSLINR
jgi:hypothetical protein